MRTASPGDHGHQASARTESEGAFAPGQEPFELRVLTARLDQRTNGIMAFWLRRSGEHQLANLLVERPEEYERLVGGGSFRWRRCA